MHLIPVITWLRCTDNVEREKVWRSLYDLRKVFEVVIKFVVIKFTDINDIKYW